MKPHWNEKLSLGWEKCFRKIGNRKAAKALILTVLWCCAVVCMWCMFVELMRRPFTDPSSFVFMLLLLLPYFPFRVHRYLVGNTWYGIVLDATYTNKTIRVSGKRFARDMRDAEIEGTRVTVRSDSGDRKELELYSKHIRSAEGSMYYQREDRIVKLKNLPYPVKLPIPEYGEILCPNCGNRMDVRTGICSWCHTDYTY